MIMLRVFRLVVHRSVTVIMLHRKMLALPMVI